MLKFFIIAVLIFVSVNGLSQELKEKFLERMEQIGGECAEEVGANEDDIAELLAHKIPTRHEGQCMVFCFHKRFGMMHEDGTIHHEGSLKMMEPLKADDPDLYNKFVEIGIHCAANTKKDEDKCVFAANLAQCAFERGREVGLDDSIFE